MARSLLALVKTLCLVLHVHSCACGEAEIIGGKKVKAHSLPYMVLLYGKGKGCGGTLLSSRWVLTAAHCSKEPDFSVRLGVDKISTSFTDNSVLHRNVAKSYPHPDYDKTTKVHDLQLLKLDEEVKETNTIQYLKLANDSQDPLGGDTCMVAGWGAVGAEDNKMSDVLMSANVTVIKRETCNSREYYNNNPVITPDMVCAGTVEGPENRDTCQGDSGGPLMCNGVQVGITSFGHKICALRTRPGVFTFLSKQHIDWIKKTMQKQEFF